jgi:putative ubiquitin-RnfH superfamily antitoxin RatB of RatAB toxin-antitoxin module
VLAQAALQMGISAAQLQGLQLGVWGKKVAMDHPLSDADRLELYRPLTVDPKVARRARFVRQGAKSAGLFAKRRANSKAGY